MATAPSSESLAVSGWDPASDSKSDRYLAARLAAAGADCKSVAVATFILAAALAALAWLVVGIMAEHWLVPGGLPAAARWAWFVAGVAALAGAVVRWLVPLIRYRVNLVYAAREIEHDHPELHNDLVNAVLVKAHPDSSSPLVARSLERRAAKRLSDVPADGVADRAVPLRLTMALAAVVALLVVYGLFAPKSLAISAARLIAPWWDRAAPARVRIDGLRLAWRLPPDGGAGDRPTSPLEPVAGTATLVRGRQLVVETAVEGLRADERPVLVVTPVRDGAAAAWEVPLSGAPDRGGMTAVVPDAQRGLDRSVDLHVAAGDARGERVRVEVVDMPTLLVREVRYDYPAYTRRPPVTVEWEGDLEAPEFTKVTLVAEGNRPLEAAWIDPGCAGKPSEKKEMRIRPQDLSRASAEFPLLLNPERSGPQFASYRLVFQPRSAAGSREPPVVEKLEHRVEVIPDVAPEVAIESPEDAIRVPPSAPVTIRVRAVDPDYGLARVGIEARIKDGRTLEPAWILERIHEGAFIGDAQIVPERVGAHAGSVIEYRAVAIDTRPEPNVTHSQWRSLVVDAAATAPPPPPRGPAGGGGDANQDGAPAGADGPQDAARGGEQRGAGPDGQGKPQQGGGAGQQERQPGAGAGANEPEQQAGSGGNESGNPQQAPGGGVPRSDGKTDNGTSGEGSARDGAGRPGDQSGKDGRPQQGGEAAGKQSGGDGPRGEQAGGERSGDQRQGGGEAQQNGGQQGGGKEAGGKEAGGKEAGGKESGGKESGGKESGGKEAGGKESGGKESGGKESGGKEAGGKEAGGKEAGGKEAGGKRRDGRGESAPRNAVASDGTNDGEAMERILRHRDGEQEDASGSPAGRSGDRPKPEGDQPGPAGSPRPEKDPSRQGQSEAGQKNDAPGREQEAGQKPPCCGDDGKPCGKSGCSSCSGGGKSGGSSGGGAGSGQPGAGQPGQGASGGGKAGGGTSGEGKAGEGDASGGETGSGKAGAGKTGGGQSGDGKSGDGKSGDGKSGDGKSGDGKSGDGKSGDGKSGDGKSGDGKSGDGKSGDGKSGDGKSGDQPGEGKSGEGKPGAGQAGTGETGQQSGGDRADGAPTGAGAEVGAGGQVGGNRGGASPPASDADRAPRDVEWTDQDVAHARNAADLALEHLRDSMNAGRTDVLDELGWTEEQARAFLDRWEAMRQVEGPAGARQRGEFERALRSLGLRPPGASVSRDTATDVRGGQAEGRRSRPPAAYREQFEAFLRGAGGE